MSFNLVDLVKGQLGGPALGQLGALLGEDNNKTEVALGAAIPGLLSGLTSSANADGGGSLFNAIKDADDSLLDNIGGMLTGGNSSNMMNQGGDLLGSLLGSGALGGLASAVAGFTGIGKKSSSGLMGILAPIIMGIIKRKLFGGSGFSQNASGLLGLLNGQQSNIQSAMPAGFTDQLQSSGFMDQIASLGGGAANLAGNAADAAGNAVSGAANAAGNVAGSAVDTAGDVASSGGGFLKKILPIAILVALALLAWNFIKGKPAPDVSGTVSSAVDTAKDAMPSIDIDGTDVGAEFGNIFSSATSTVAGITDVESAKAAVPSFNEITGKVDGLSGLWDKVPEAGQGQLGGMISDNLGKLTPALDKVQEIPGVGDVIGPVAGPLLEKLMAFTK
jgi:hypothetical protein